MRERNAHFAASREGIPASRILFERHSVLIVQKRRVYARAILRLLNVPEKIRVAAIRMEKRIEIFNGRFRKKIAEADPGNIRKEKETHRRNVRRESHVRGSLGVPSAFVRIVRNPDIGTESAQLRP